VPRYVESNQRRAGLASDLADDPWSSYPARAQGRADGLPDPAPVWAGLGRTAAGRQDHGPRWRHTPLTARERAGVTRTDSPVGCCW
jgi:hypothetical protein